MFDQPWENWLVSPDEHQLSQVFQCLDHPHEGLNTVASTEDHVQAGQAHSSTEITTIDSASLTNRDQSSQFWNPSQSHSRNATSSPPYADPSQFDTLFAANADDEIFHGTLLSKPRTDEIVEGRKQSGNIAPKPFPCFLCYEKEETEPKQYGTKGALKKHQEYKHPETGLRWSCTRPGCEKIVCCRSDLEKHLRDAHDGSNLPEDYKGVYQTRRIYGCGFNHCVFDTWKDFHDHVCTHLRHGHNSWSFNNIILNLLKHPKFCGQWEKILDILCPKLRISSHILTWSQETNRMKQQMENLDLGNLSVEQFLSDLFVAGIADSQLKQDARQLLQRGIP